MGEPRPVRVLTIGPAPLSADSRGGMATVLTLMQAHPDPRVTIRVVPTYADHGLVRRTLLGLRGMLVASALILAGRVDVLHVHLAHGGSVARKSLPLAAARLRGTATVVHEHSYDFAGWFDRLPAWGRALVRRGVAADVWLVLATHHVTEFGRRLHMDEERIRVLHNPVVLPRPAARHAVPGAHDVVRAVSLGRLGHRKGSYDVVAAVAQLPSDVRGRLGVVLAGDGEVDEVRAVVARAGVSDVVEVRGWQGPAERDDLVRRSDVFLLPSYEEGLPMAMLEAMAQGLAPIVSPVGGIPNVVGDGVEGLLVEPGDVDALAVALRRLVDDPALRQRVAAAARSRAEHFDVDHWYDDLTELWISLDRAARRSRG
ncbi:glycosyltransferase family 4 protein [Aeromicrobium sp. CFBP 8757]|uniref:glycosyltransferase family 4 protein n=1 Tax=Aeromicrobium sp. CFBP 8757 TaxID=2775288 RepID=UPI00177C1B63|nr:glycosyltransferase family 4 protein [Aeromicrobium sp. CFBP 8757]MBD8605258.1 glycosyltransferase family 4 protein [Aeromicrobium sp. CFBP 8757]